MRRHPINLNFGFLLVGPTPLLFIDSLVDETLEDEDGDAAIIIKNQNQPLRSFEMVKTTANK